MGGHSPREGVRQAVMRGLYAGASAMLVHSLRQDLLANDLANAQTVGYRPQDAPVAAFPQLALDREVGIQRSPIGTAGTGAYVEQSFVRWSARGALRHTSRSLDVAIEGDGFFVVQTPAGLRLTRAGQFHVGAGGVLQTPDGHPVMGVTGPISLAGEDADEVVITRDGTLWGARGQPLGQLLVVDVADRQGLAPEGATLYRPTPASGDPVRVPDAAVLQGVLEDSGTSVVRAMVDMIAAVRAYQASQVAVRMHDELTGELIQQVGRSS